MSWLPELFGVQKPIIGMCHLMALPGDPGYDSNLGVDAVVRRARRELDSLQGGGVDGVMISNEFSLPYLTKTEPITAITMGRVVGELLPDLSVPFGVNVLWDGRASIDLAVATGASFVREIFTGVYASDFGLWNTNVGETARHRRAVDGQHVKLFFNVVPESAAYLAARDLGSLTRTTVFAALPDALCVSGDTAGSETDRAALSVVKKAAGDVPVLVNTGVNPTNVADLLAVGDGAIVGTFFKEDGIFEKMVDGKRVADLMSHVQELRASRWGLAASGPASSSGTK